MTNHAHMTTGGEFLTTREAGQLLRVSRATVRRMVADGRLVAAQKLPGSVGAYLFDPAEVDRALRVLEERYAS